MKTLNLLFTVCLFLILSSVAKSQERFNITFDQEEWYVPNEGQMALYTENGNFVMEVFTVVEEPWQGACIKMIDVDLEKYPNLRITTVGDMGAEWNIKVSAPAHDDQYCLFTMSTEGGNDKSDFGSFDFEGTISEIFGETGNVSFDLWLWVIGRGERLVVSELFLYDDNYLGIGANLTEVAYLVNKPGGVIVKNAENKAIQIYSVQGLLISDYTIKNNEEDINLQKGMYIIKVGDSLLKTVVY